MTQRVKPRWPEDLTTVTVFDQLRELDPQLRIEEDHYNRLCLKTALQFEHDDAYGGGTEWGNVSSVHGDSEERLMENVTQALRNAYRVRVGRWPFHRDYIWCRVLKQWERHGAPNHSYWGRA